MHDEVGFVVIARVVPGHCAGAFAGALYLGVCWVLSRGVTQLASGLNHRAMIAIIAEVGRRG